ncbi:MAG: hypothetical protein IKO27_07845 [Ruminococcus sp.]|nr:hypothetical protein [Ruminococcus sp.]
MAEAKRDIKIIEGEYTGKPPRPLRQTLDLLIGACLIAAPLWAALTYFRITVVCAGFGLVFLIVQKILDRGEPSAAVRRVSMGLRIFACVILCFAVFVVSGLGSGMKGLFSVRKGLYCLGNGIDSAELEFMPGIPSGSSDFYMNFSAPRVGQEGGSNAAIHFTADEEGVSTFRDEIISKGGKLEETDSFVHKKLRIYCEDNGKIIGRSEVYSMGETGEHCPACLVDPETGFCVIYW